MGGPDATPDLWKQPFSAVRASGGYPGNVALADHREITMTGLCAPRFHAPLHIFPPPPAGSPSHCTGGKMRPSVAFNVTLLILVLEIPFNLQFDMQCAGNANSNVSFQGQPPQDNSVGFGVVWETGLFSLCISTRSTSPILWAPGAAKFGL